MRKKETSWMTRRRGNSPLPGKHSSKIRGRTLKVKITEKTFSGTRKVALAPIGERASSGERARWTGQRSSSVQSQQGGNILPNLKSESQSSTRKKEVETLRLVRGERGALMKEDIDYLR